jgi:HK97 family phage major capsid protein
METSLTMPALEQKIKDISATVYDEKGIPKDELAGMQEKLKKNNEYLTGLQSDMNAIKESLPRIDAAMKVNQELDAESRAQQGKLTRADKELFKAIMISTAPEGAFGTLDSKVLREKALAAIKEAGVLVRKTDYNNAGTAADGQYVAPIVAENAMLSIAAKYSVALRNASILPVSGPGRQFTWPVDLEGGTFTYPGAGTAANASKAVFGQLAITPLRGVCKMITTRELIDFSNIDVVAHLIEKIGIASANDIDKQVFAGTGSPITGLRGASTLAAATVSGSTFTTTGAEIKAAIGKLLDINMQDGMTALKWYMEWSTYWNFIATITTTVTTSGSLNPYPGIADPQSIASKQIMGMPIEFCRSDAMYPASSSGATSCFAICADLKKSVVLANFGIEQIRVTEDATVLDAAGTAMNLWDVDCLAVMVRRYFAGGLPDFSSLSKYPGVKLSSV